MEYKFAWLHDGDYYYTKKIGALIPLETRCSFYLVYKDEIDIFVCLTAYEYFYNIEQDFTEVRFTDSEDGFEIESEDMLKLWKIINSNDFDPTELKMIYEVD